MEIIDVVPVIIVKDDDEKTCVSIRRDYIDTYGGIISKYLKTKVEKTNLFDEKRRAESDKYYAGEAE